MNNTFVASILNDGADAYSNLYDVKVTFPWDISGLSYITARAEGVKTPDIGTEMDEREYKGNKYKTPKPEQTGERMFDITFRLDANYSLYSNFAKWASLVGDPASGGVSNWASYLGTIEILGAGTTYSAISEETGLHNTADNGALTEDNNAKWKFTKVWAQKCTGLEFKTKGSDALTYTVTFCYADSSQPFLNNTDISGGA